MNDNLLEINNLTVTFPTLRGDIDVVSGFNLTMGREKIGIVGESGSGKSMTAKSILRLVKSPGRQKSDKLNLNGISLQDLTEKEMRKVCGKEIAMVLQDPRFSLNPVMTVKAQMLEAFRLNRKSGKAKEVITQALEDVSITDIPRVLASYPHELSGGMGQRIMIAMMMLGKPQLLIADEPTSALDTTVQKQVLFLMDDMVKKQNIGLIFISHDLPLVADFCDRIIVMYKGRVVEECKASELHLAKHPYTQGLLSCLPSAQKRGMKLPILERQLDWEK